MEYTLRTRVNVSRSTKGVWTPDATVEVTTTQEPRTGMSVPDMLGDEKRFAMNALETTMKALELAYPFVAEGK